MQCRVLSDFEALFVKAKKTRIALMYVADLLQKIEEKWISEDWDQPMSQYCSMNPPQFVYPQVHIYILFLFFPFFFAYINYLGTAGQARRSTVNPRGGNRRRRPLGIEEEARGGSAGEGPKSRYFVLLFLLIYVCFIIIFIQILGLDPQQPNHGGK